MLPIAEVERDEKNAAAALLGGPDDFQFAGIGQPVLHRHAALNAPQVHQLQGEFPMEPVGGLFGSGSVAGKDGQEIPHHHLAALAAEKKIKLGHD